MLCMCNGNNIINIITVGAIDLILIIINIISCYLIIMIVEAFLLLLPFF